MSAASEVAVCNAALTQLGGGTITSFSDGTTEAKLSEIHYPRSRDAVLNETEWKFATRRFGPMTPEVDPPVFEWSYSYVLPTDLLKLLWAGGRDGKSELARYEVENNRLLCDVAGEVYIKYTARITDTTKFSQSFTEALVARLAAELAAPVTESRETEQLKFGVAEEKMATGTAVDNQQGRNQPTHATRHLRARWSGGRYGGYYVTDRDY